MSAGRVDLSWTASTSAVGIGHYDVLRNGAVIGQAPGTAYSDTTVTGGNTYSYSVVAIDTTLKAAWRRETKKVG